MAHLRHTDLPLCRPGRWALIVLLVVSALFPVAASAAADRTSLHRVTRNGYSILVPDGWQFRNASKPSDHLTHVYRDPQHPNRKLRVIVSLCVGCVLANPGDVNDRTLDLEQLLPAGVVSHIELGRWTLAYKAFRAGNPLPDNGVIKVWHHGNDIEGYAQVDLWLPDSQRATATKVLNSLRLK